MLDLTTVASPSVSGHLLAAGSVVGRRVGKEVQVLLVHRPKYDDWSFPKGKLDPHEHITMCAVREVAEETGLDIRLGPPLSTQSYSVRNGRTRTKDVHYWAGRLVGDGDISTYLPNTEIDRLVWLPVEQARKRLTYPHDRQTLDEFVAVSRKTRTLIVLRHTKARARRGWTKDDRQRPLTKVGEFQAQQLVPILGAYGAARLVSSTSLRCRQTLQPYADVVDGRLETTADLSEEGATPELVRDVVDRLLGTKRPIVLCTHRPVLPLVWDALGLRMGTIDPGSLAVVHHRRGDIVATEVHGAPSGR